MSKTRYAARAGFNAEVRAVFAEEFATSAQITDPPCSTSTIGHQVVAAKKTRRCHASIFRPA